eukprot:TRINITY_DN11039_c0_g1_i1.p1 TRINITY_DN11039_c0_g1~~TRINITY_DN11039_c0_g1_i1.p1  ORF type:complete len:129 (-),score=14.50 TRINITY_DN11039_c0_g1_i1:96-482(-)
MTDKLAPLFISCSVIILSMFIFPIYGLQCYQKSITVSSTPIQSKLANCTEGQVCAIIGTSEKLSTQSCFTKIPLVGNGCKEAATVKTCQCETDGCNETLEKAAMAGAKIMVAGGLIIYSILILLVQCA